MHKQGDKVTSNQESRIQKLSLYRCRVRANYGTATEQDAYNAHLCDRAIWASQCHQRANEPLLEQLINEAEASILGVKP